jgi:iron complex outermembrane receptor protein
MAAFSQVDWAITDSWKMTVGLRYTEDEKRGTELTRQLCWGLSAFFGCPDLAVGGTNSPVADVTDNLIFHNAPPGANGAATYDATTGIWSRGLDGRWHATTGTAGVEWSPNSDALVYAKYSRGYKVRLNSGSIVQFPMTDPGMDAYEVGWKQQLLDRVQTNASVFYYAYKGMQIPLCHPGQPVRRDSVLQHGRGDEQGPRVGDDLADRSTIGGAAELRLSGS